MRLLSSLRSRIFLTSALLAVLAALLLVLARWGRISAVLWIIWAGVALFAVSGLPNTGMESLALILPLGVSAGPVTLVLVVTGLMVAWRLWERAKLG